MHVYTEIRLTYRINSIYVKLYICQSQTVFVAFTLYKFIRHNMFTEKKIFVPFNIAKDQSAQS